MQRYESYKSSAIPWIDELPQHWGEEKGKWLHRFRKDLNKRKQCDNVLSLTLRGVVNNDPDDPEGLVPKDYGTYQIFEKDDLVFKLIDLENFRTSRVGLVHERGIMSPAYLRVQPGKKHSPRYFYYYYFTLYQQGIYNKLGAGVRSTLGPTDLLEIGVPVPSKDEQDRIVAFLDQKTAEIDAAIAKKERLIELLQEQKNIRIHQAVLRGLNPEVPLCDSGVSWIGAVPAHWKVIPNRYIFREQNARSLRGEETHLSMSQRYGLVPAKELDVQTLQSESYDGAKLCQRGDLVQNRLKAHLAVFAVAPCDGLVSPDYSVFRLQNSENLPVYFERLFKTPNYLGEFNRRVRGIVVGFLRLYSEDFNAIPALVPPSDEQAEIVKFIEATNTDFENIRAKIDAEIVMLRELKAITVASAVTGKIKV